MARTIIVGDIHGCVQTFRKLLDKCGFDEAQDRLIILGDAFDRGPSSCAVFLKLLHLEQKMGERFSYILGNHDQMLMDAQSHPGMDLLWLQNGSDATIRSFEKENGDLEALCRWLSTKPYFLKGEAFNCVHAGVEPEDPENNEREVLLWSRVLLQGAQRYGGRLVLAGHTPVPEAVYIPPEGNVQLLREGEKLPLPKQGAMILDTGCVYQKKLTALITEDGYYRILYAPYGECEPCR